MEDDDDAKEQARRDYVWRRNSEIFWEVEALWQSYMRELNYPQINFVDYVSSKHKPPHRRVKAQFSIRIWKLLREFSPMHQN
jgi:hypothetical protein